MSAGYTRGRFVWHEVFTPDPQRTGQFYGEVLAWRTESRGDGYHVLYDGQQPVAGMVDVKALPVEDVPARWLGYVSVADVDADAERTARLAGHVLSPATSVAEVGRFAVVQDPKGAVFSLFCADKADPPAVMQRYFRDELWTGEPDKATAFYSEVLGWQRRALGNDDFAFAHGSEDAATMRRGDLGWLALICVRTLARFKDRALAHGATLEHERGLPDGTVALLRDPQGIAFGLFSPN
jgi:predicted enzyme related to lactoylglutathione lyase